MPWLFRASLLPLLLSAAAAMAQPVAIAITGAVKKPVNVELTALQSMPAVTQSVGGTLYQGVSLWTLLNEVAGIAGDPAAKNPTITMYLVATGSDGYRALIALPEIDPKYGNKPLLVAYSANGAPLRGNGQPRLVVPGDAMPSRGVFNLTGIDVRALPPR